MLEALIEDGGSSYYRSGEGPTTGFVNSTDEHYEIPIDTQFFSARYVRAGEGESKPANEPGSYADSRLCDTLGCMGLL